MKTSLIFRVETECLLIQKTCGWIQPLRRQRLPAPILIGHWPCHKLLAKCLCVLEKGCVYICACLSCRHLCMCLCVCVLDRWAGDSDRLVCSQHFFWSVDQRAHHLTATADWGMLTRTHTHTQAFYTCMHTLPFLWSHMGTMWAYHTHANSDRLWQILKRTNWYEWINDTSQIHQNEHETVKTQN